MVSQYHGPKLSSTNALRPTMIESRLTSTHKTLKLWLFFLSLRGPAPYLGEHFRIYYPFQIPYSKNQRDPFQRLVTPSQGMKTIDGVLLQDYGLVKDVTILVVSSLIRGARGDFSSSPLKQHSCKDETRLRRSIPLGSKVLKQLTIF